MCFLSNFHPSFLIIIYYHPFIYPAHLHTREHELMKIHKSHLKIKRIKSLTFLNANNPGHAFILVYSVTSRQSLEELKPMWEMIRSIKGDLTDIPVILVGNKCDETDNREVVQVCFVFFFYPYHTPLLSLSHFLQVQYVKSCNAPPNTMNPQSSKPFIMPCLFSHAQIERIYTIAFYT